MFLHITKPCVCYLTTEIKFGKKGASFTNTAVCLLKDIKIICLVSVLSSRDECCALIKLVDSYVPQLNRVSL